MHLPPPPHLPPNTHAPNQTHALTPASLLRPPPPPRLPFRQGASLHMVLDVPTTKPYSPADIDTLVAAKDTAYCPFYLDLMAGVHQVWPRGGVRHAGHMAAGAGMGPAGAGAAGGAWAGAEGGDKVPQHQGPDV